jgi:hypothetical protein
MKKTQVIFTLFIMVIPLILIYTIVNEYSKNPLESLESYSRLVVGDELYEILQIMMEIKMFGINLSIIVVYNVKKISLIKLGII